MPNTDTSEQGLESLIVAQMIRPNREIDSATADNTASEGIATYGGSGYFLGDAADYDKDYALDLVQLLAFLQNTQPATYEALELGTAGPKRTKFLARLSTEIGKRGVVDVLRRGIKDGSANVTLFYGSPTPGNTTATRLYAENRFSITRQLRYSKTKPNNALDLCIFINGLPLFTFELKNSLTKQTVEDAIQQYKRDRDPKDLLLQFKRCLAHFALDDQQVQFCPRLDGDASWFLPFNKGYKEGAGNPPNPNGIKTDYLWRKILLRESLTDILENYAQLVREKNSQTGRERENLIFPRYHQLDVVRQLLTDVRAQGVGQKYLVQHSAGSGKSNSIAWLAYQLVELQQDNVPLFDSVLVLTDRRNLDKQIHTTIKGFMDVSAVLAHAHSSDDLRRFITAGKKIIVTTVQKFPFIVDEIGNAHRNRKFALIIDEAHSSQSGSTAAKVSMALSSDGATEDDETMEDAINRILESRKMLPNASYFAFTATPKAKTLEMFGIQYTENGEKKFRPFHSYSMKQATQEGFILDVLKSYTPINSYYRLAKAVEEDPEFDVKKAQKKLRAYVENNEHAIQEKAEIIVEHFLTQVIARHKVGGQARAMVVTSSIAKAIEYYHAISRCLQARKSHHKAIVAFTGEHKYGGQSVTESSLNGFPSNDIEQKMKEDPYRILVCADKFQTGYDEPLLHTMYVDKKLAGVQAVQTLSRLNRAHPKKLDTFVLDFFNTIEGIQQSFQPYYQTTLLSRESDPNRLHDLVAIMDAHEIYTDARIDSFVALYLAGASREKLDPILDQSAQIYQDTLDTSAQIEFKGSAKAFVRNYNFLASILPYSLPEWEKLSIFLTLLIPKLPAPKEDDLAQGILDSIDMESYRAEKLATQAIELEDANAEISPTDVGGSGHQPEPELDRLSNILRQFNELFGNIPFTDQDRVIRLITEEIPATVAADPRYQNAMQHSDKSSAKIEHDHALERAAIAFIRDHTEFFKQFKDNPDFHRFVTNLSFQETYHPPKA